MLSWKCKRTRRSLPLMNLGKLIVNLALCLLKLKSLSFLVLDFGFLLFDRASVLLSVLETLKGFVIIYERLSSFPEIFMPVCDLLQQTMQNSNLPRLLRDKMQDVFDLIKKKTDDHQIYRQPLQMRKQKPVPMKLLNPKFEEKYVANLKHMLSFILIRYNFCGRA